MGWYVFSIIFVVKTKTAKFVKSRFRFVVDIPSMPLCMTMAAQGRVQGETVMLVSVDILIFRWVTVSYPNKDLSRAGGPVYVNLMHVS